MKRDRILGIAGALLFTLSGCGSVRTDNPSQRGGSTDGDQEFALDGQRSASAISSQSVGEDLCDDFYDNDGNGLTDCEDPSCQATAACVPGQGAVGAPCDVNDQCTANAGDPLCIAETWSGWPAGYCSEFCDLVTNDCAPGATCLDVGLGSGNGLCFAECAANADCQPGYYCDQGYAGVCLPGTAPEYCDNQVDDNGDGLVDCADPQCSHAPTCPEVACDDWSDNEYDGATDCGDTDCQGTAACTPGAAATGAPCDASNQCAATGGDPTCLTEWTWGWPSGYCAEFCSLAANDCAPGATCLDLGLSSGNGVCFADCTTNADCRAGYSCLDVGGQSICASH